MLQNKHIRWFTLFILSLLGISLYYGYHRIVFYPPQSIHAWRQSDCASMTMNYYQYGMKFFQPEIHNLIADHGTTGYVAPSEIPVYYYAMAGLYKIVGPHDFLIRLFNLLIFLTGLLYLFRLFLEVLKDHFWAGALSILIFTSPVLVYYACNYLTNITAFSFTIIGCYHFFRFYKQKENRSLYLSALMFLLTGSMKITGLFSVMVIIILFLSEGMRPGSGQRNDPGIFNHSIRKVLPFVAILPVIAGWIFYAQLYNKQHVTAYFSTRIFPIWDFDMEGIKQILHSAVSNWFQDYFSPATHLFLALLFISLIINYRHINKVLVNFSIYLLPLLVLYVILQFYVFADHDYYTINMFILPVFIMAGSMEGLMKRFPKVTRSFAVKLAFLAFLAWNIHYAKHRLELRYTGWRNDSAEMLVYQEIRDRLQGMGIAQTDTVITISGRSPQALYLLNMKGWTEYSGPAFKSDSIISYNLDSTGIQASIDKGARYLFVGGFEQIVRKPYLMSFTKDLIGQHRGLLVFDLLSEDTNFDVQARRIISEIICDAEQISLDGQSFLTSVDSVVLGNGSTRTSKVSWSGTHSAMLTGSQPFAMTLTLPGVSMGHVLEVSAWILDPSEQCRIIASSENAGQLYLNSNETGSTDSTGWSRKILRFTVPEKLDHQTLKIYLYYPGRDTVYCDDLHILQYVASKT